MCVFVTSYGVVVVDVVVEVVGGWARHVFVVRPPPRGGSPQGQRVVGPLPHGVGPAPPAPRPRAGRVRS